jgi:hypothetical protein
MITNSTWILAQIGCKSNKSLTSHTSSRAMIAWHTLAAKTAVWPLEHHSLEPYMKHLKCFSSIRCAVTTTNSVTFDQLHLKQSHDSLTHTGCQDCCLTIGTSLIGPIWSTWSASAAWPK